MLEQEVDRLSNIALVFAAFRSLDAREVQPLYGLPLEDATNVVQSIRSIDISVVFVPVALCFLKEADDLRFSRFGQLLAEPLTSQPRSVLTPEVIEPPEMKSVVEVNPIADVLPVCWGPRQPQIFLRRQGLTSSTIRQFHNTAN